MKNKTLLVHGFSLSKDYFQNQKGIAGIETQAIDLPGHGANKAYTDGTLESFAKALDENFPCVDYVLCGHSMGASVVLEYQRLFPQKAKGIVLVDTAAKFLLDDSYLIGTPKEAIDEATAGLKADREGFYKGFIPAMFKEAPSNETTTKLLTEMMKANPEVALNSLQSFSAMDYREILSGIKIPALVMHGRHDHLYPVAAAEYLHDKIDGSRLVVFEDSGHCPHIEEAARFNKELSDFVKSIRGD